jgi:hypothetical protein
MRAEVVPLVDPDKWAQIEPWVISPGETAVCPK